VSACNRPLARVGPRADHADHVEDAHDAPLVDGMDREAAARKIGGDTGPHARFLAPGPRRAHDVAGDANDAILLAEQIERLDRLLSEAADSFRRKQVFPGLKETTTAIDGPSGNMSGALGPASHRRAGE
jgi:hypothetical protein